MDTHDDPLDDPLDDPAGRPVYTSRRFARRQDGRHGRRTALLALVAIVVLGGVGWLAWSRVAGGDAPAPVIDRAVATDSVSPPDPRPSIGVAADTPTEPLPSLDESDATVRRLARAISSRPAVAAWFVTDDLVRRFVLAVTKIANGGSPLEQLDFMEVEGDFQVVSHEGGTVIDPASYRRYDALVGAFVSLDPDGSAGLYRRLRPLFDEAYRELGLGGDGFEPVLARAVANLRSVPVPSPPVRVQPTEAVWGYADPELESRTAAEKHLMRMGPENARRVQAKLAELATALGLPIRETGPAR